MFGTNTTLSETAAKITAKHTLLSPSTLPFTNAVVQETLRIIPAAGTIRTGQPGFNLIDPNTGKTYPTYINGQPLSLMQGGFAIMRNEAMFPEPDVWDPWRFLPRSYTGPPGYTPNPQEKEEGEQNKRGRLEDMPKDAWRPFEKGPRHCIGLELAYLEMRTVLAVAARFFETTTMYRDSTSPLVMGERAYPVLTVTAKPAEGLPVKVTIVDETKV